MKALVVLLRYFIGLTKITRTLGKRLEFFMKNLGQ